MFTYSLSNIIQICVFEKKFNKIKTKKTLGEFFSSKLFFKNISTSLIKNLQKKSLGIEKIGFLIKTGEKTGALLCLKSFLKKRNMKKNEININRILLRMGISTDPYDYKIISGFLKIELNKTLSGKLKAFRKFKSYLSFFFYNTRNLKKNLKLLISLKQNKPREAVLENLSHPVLFISRILYGHIEIIFHYLKKKNPNENFSNLNLSNLLRLFNNNNSYISLEKILNTFFLFQIKKFFCSNIYFIFFKLKSFILRFFGGYYKNIDYSRLHEFHMIRNRTIFLRGAPKKMLKTVLVPKGAFFSPKTIC
jgi:hypothetical protein